MLKDGLWDVYNDFAMGNCAELCAVHHSITREEQVRFLDAFFLEKHISCFLCVYIYFLLFCKKFKKFEQIFTREIIIGYSISFLL